MTQDYKQLISQVRPEMYKAFHFLEEELLKIRSSRVLPSLIDKIRVDLFGQSFELQQLGNITVGDARQLVMQPWDQSYLEAIAAAIQKSGISGSPVVDGQLIRVNFPALSAEYRQDMVRKANELAEQVKQTIRKWREKVWNEVQDKTRASEIREDDKFKAKDELQKLIDDYNEKISKLIAAKEKELLE